MKRILTWLMLFCVMTGLSARVLATELGRAVECTHLENACCDDEQRPDAHEGHSHDHDGEDCPPGHHHHHDCCFGHAAPLTLDHISMVKLRLPNSFLLAVIHDQEAPPEGPYLIAEKPPLI